MTHKNKNIRLHCAAFYFSHISRDLNELAIMFDVSKDTIRRWAKSKEWDVVLQELGYNGDRSFIRQPKRDTARDAGEIFQQAKVVYQNTLKAGTPHHKLATVTAQILDVNPRRIRDWARKYKWRDTQ